LTDFQLKIIDIITTPDEEYERAIEELNEKYFSIFEFLEADSD